MPRSMSHSNLLNVDQMNQTNRVQVKQEFSVDPDLFSNLSFLQEKAKPANQQHQQQQQQQSIAFQQMNQTMTTGSNNNSSSKKQRLSK